MLRESRETQKKVLPNGDDYRKHLAARGYEWYLSPRFRGDWYYLPQPSQLPLNCRHLVADRVALCREHADKTAMVQGHTSSIRIRP